jgi:hypothetical protein
MKLAVNDQKGGAPPFSSLRESSSSSTLSPPSKLHTQTPDPVRRGCAPLPSPPCNPNPDLGSEHTLTLTLPPLKTNTGFRPYRLPVLDLYDTPAPSLL